MITLLLTMALYGMTLLLEMISQYLKFSRFKRQDGRKKKLPTKTYPDFAQFSRTTIANFKHDWELKILFG